MKALYMEVFKLCILVLSGFRIFEIASRWSAVHSLGGSVLPTLWYRSRFLQMVWVFFRESNSRSTSCGASENVMSFRKKKLWPKTPSVSILVPLNASVLPKAHLLLETGRRNNQEDLFSSNVIKYSPSTRIEMFGLLLINSAKSRLVCWRRK